MDIFSYKLGQKRGGGSGGGGSVRLQNKTFNANGTYKADAGYDGLGTVTVDVAGSGGIAAGISYDEVDYNRFNETRKYVLKKATVYGTAVPSNAFTSQGFVTQVTLPDSITRIDHQAFQSCYSLVTTKFPSSLQEIGGAAFQSNYKLTATEFPSELKTIDSYAFYGCTGLTTLTFNGTPTSIYNDAFGGCTNLTVINVPWAEGAVANAPWGATNATINYNYTGA